MSIEVGTGDQAKLPVWAAGKTGTTQSYRDAWFVGWADDIVTAVWVGNRAAQVPMTNVHGIAVTGGSFPASIWRQFMTEAGGRPGGRLGDRAHEHPRSLCRVSCARIEAACQPALPQHGGALPACQGRTGQDLHPALVDEAR